MAEEIKNRANAENRNPKILTAPLPKIIITENI
jgi:hypothetical protein